MVDTTLNPETFLAAIVPPEHLAALATAGSVQPESLESGNTSYKLRYRVARDQKAIRIGSDPVYVAQVRAAVEWLQRPTRNRREIVRLLESIRERLQHARRLIAQAAQQLATSSPANEKQSPNEENYSWSTKIRPPSPPSAP
jgi:hypothetical protein